jgi:hypothetical protein
VTPRRALIILICASLAFAVFLANASSRLLHSPRLQSLLAHELAHSLNCEVAVGPVEAGLLTSVTLHGLAVARDGVLSRGAFVSAEYVEVSFSPLNAMLRGDVSRAVRRVEVEGVRVQVERRADGSVVMPAAARSSKAGQGSALPRALLEAHDVSLQYLDHSLLSADGEPLQGTLTGADLICWVGRLGRMLRGEPVFAGTFTCSGRLRVTCGPQRLDTMVSLTPYSVALRDLSFEDDNLPDRLDAQSMEVGCNLHRLFERKPSVGQAVSSVLATAPRVQLTRAADGSFPILHNVSRWFRSQSRAAQPRLRIEVTKGVARYADYALQRQDKPLLVSATKVDAEVLLGRLQREIQREQRRRTGSYSADVTVKWGDLRAATQLSGRIGRVAEFYSTWATLAGRPLLSARLLRAYYGPRFFAGEGLAAVQRVELERPTADLVLDANNRPDFLPANLTQSAGSGGHSGRADRKRPFTSQIVFRQASLALAMNALRAPGGPLRLKLSQGSGDLDLAALHDPRSTSLGPVSGAFSASLGDLTLATQLGGKLGGNLGLSNLRVTQKDREVLSAGQAGLGLDCHRLGSDPLGSLQLVDLRGLRGRLVRDRDGRFAALRPLQAALGSASRGQGRSQGVRRLPRLRLDGSEISYTDLGTRGGLREAYLRSFAADLDLQRLAAASRGDRGALALGSPGYLRGELTGWGPALRLRADLTADLAGSLRVRNAALTTGSSGDTIRLAFGQVGFDPRRVFTGESLTGLRSVTLRNARAEVTRERDGQWRLVRLARSAAGLGAPKANARSAGRPSTAVAGLTGATVTLADVKVQITDRSAPVGPVIAWARNLKGTATTARGTKGRISGTLGLRSPQVDFRAGLTTDLSSSASLSRVEAYDRTWKAPRRLLTADSATIRYDLAQALSGKAEASLREVFLRGFDADLRRRPSGDLRVAGLLRGLWRTSPRQGSGPTASAVRPVLEFANGRVVYTDEITGQGHLVVSARNLQGRVATAALLSAKSALSRRTDAGWLQAEMTVQGNDLTAEGALKAELSRRLTVAGLRVAPTGVHAAEPWILAQEGTVDFRLADLLAGPPLDAVTRVALTSPRLSLLRDVQGNWDLERALASLSRPAPAGARPLDWGQLLAALSVQDGQVHYVDQFLPTPGQPPLVADLRDLAGELTPEQMEAAAEGRPTATSGRVQGTLAASWPGATASGKISTDVYRHLTVSDLVLRAASKDAPRVLARELSTEFVMSDLFDPELPALSALRKVGVTGLDADLARDAAGRVNLADLFASLSREGEPGEAVAPRTSWLDDLRAEVTLHDSSLRYTDAAGPVTVVLQGADGKLDGSLLAQLKDPKDLAGLGGLEGTVEVHLPAQTAVARVSSSDLSRRALLTDLRVLDSDTGARVASAQRADVNYDLDGLLSSTTPRQAALKRCDLLEPYADLVRDEEGHWSLAGTPPRAGTEGQQTPVGTATDFTAEVLMKGGALHVVDSFVPGGTTEVSLTQAEGDLNFGKLWAARQGRYEPEIGRLAGELKAQRAEETLAGSFDWSLDQELRCSDVSLRQAGRPLPVLTLDKGRAGYAPAALEERGDVAAALDEVSLGSVWVQARRLADGRLELPAILSAYLPRVEVQAPRQPRFLGGVTAHLHADALSGTYEDLSLQPEPLQVTFGGTSGDVYCDRLARLHEGRDAADPGGLKGAVTFTRGSDTGSGSFDVDLGGRAGLSRVLVTSKGVAEPVVSLVEGTADFDPKVLFSDESGLDGVGDVYLKQPKATISLDEQGRWALLRDVQGRGPAEAADRWALDRFVHRLTVVDGAVTYRDPRRLTDYPLLRAVDAADVNGALDFAALWEARRTGIPRDPGTLSASLRLASTDALVTGSLRTDLSTTARLTSLECRGERPARTLVSCPAATLEAPLSTWLLGKGSLGDLKRVEAWHLQANLRREESGELELLRILGKHEAESQPGTTKAAGLGGTLVLHQANLLYSDETLDVKGGVTVDGSGVDGQVDLASLQAALKGEKTGPAGRLTGFLVGHFGVFQGAGSIDTDVTGHLQVTQLRVRKPETDETAVSADQIEADYDLAAMVRDRDLTSPLASASADGLRAHLVRSPDGALELAQGLRLTSATGRRGPVPRYTKLRLTRSALQYTDYSRGRRTPLQAQAENLDASWDLAAWSAMQQDGQTRDCGFLSGDLQVTGESFRATARVSSDLSRSATAENLSFVSASGSEAEGEHLRSTRLQLAYDLGPVLQGQDWPQYLRQVTCDQLEGQLSRDASGKVRAVTSVSTDLGLRSRSGGEGLDLTGLRARVVARDSRLVYRDEALLDVGPLVASLEDANLDVDLSTVGAAGQTPTQRPRGSLSAQVSLSTPGQTAQANLRGDLEGEIALRGLRVVQTGVQKPVLSARSLSMETDLQYLLTSSPPIVSVVRALTVDGLGGSIRRDSRGVIVSPEFLSLRVRPAPTKPAEPVRLAGVVNTRVTVRNSSLSLEDEALLGEEGPIRFALQRVDGHVEAVGRVGGPIETWLKPEGKLSGVLTSETGQARLRTSFETDLANNLWLHGLESLAPDGQRLAQADEVHLGFAFDAASAGQAFARRLRAAKLNDVQIALASSPHGYLSVGGFPLRAIKMQGPSGTSFGEVSAVTGSVQTDKAGILRGSLQVRGEGGVVADALAQGSYDPVDGWLDLKATAREADLGLLGGMVLPASEGTVTARADHVTACAYGRPGTGDDQFTWAICGDTRDGRAHLPGLTDEMVHFSGPLRAGAEGVTSEKLQVAWGGVTGTATGGVLDLSDPVLSLSLDLQAERGSDLVSLLPPKERVRWRSIKLMDGARLQTSLCGSIRNANAEFRLQALGENLLQTGELGVVKVADLDVAGSILGFAKPSVRAEATARQPGIQDEAAAHGAPLPSQPVSPATRIRLVTGTDLQGVGLVEVPEADLLGVPIKDFAAQLALSRGKVQVVSAAGQVAHGRLSASGEAPFGSPEGFRMQGIARLEGARLETLQTDGLLPASLPLGGEASATFTGTYGDKTQGYGVEVNVKSPVVKGQSFDSARLLATGKGREAQIALLQLSDGPGQVCIRGSLRWPEEPPAGTQTAPPERGPVADLELAAAEFDLGKLPLGPSAEPVAGRLYAGGRLQGSLADPDVKLSLQAFDLAFEDRHADAVTGRLERRQGTLSVPRLLLCSGQAVLGLTDGRVEGFSLHSTTEPERLAPDGRIRSALVRAFGPAEGFAPLVGLGLSTDGWFSLTGAASGSLRRPVLTSMLHADTWRVGDFLLEEANLPFTLSGDTLLLTQGSARGYGGELALTGRVDDVYSRRVYTLAGNMTGISLEDLPAVEDLGQDIAGVVSLPQITVWGSRDSKPRSAVTFRVDGGRVGSEELQPITGRAQFLGDLLRVDATKIRRADSTTPEMGLPGVPGYVTVEATYDTRSRFLDAVLRVAGEERVRRGTEPTARELTTLPELGWLLRFATPVVGAIEKRMSHRAVGIGPGSTPGTSEPPGITVSERLRRLGLRTEGRLLGRVHLAGPLTALHCQAGVTLWNARLDGRALPEEMRVRLGADLADRRLYDIEAEAQDGRQYLTVTGGLDLPAGEGQTTPDASPRKVKLAIEGADIDLPMWREWLPTPLPVSGTATFTLVAAGSTESPTVKGSLDVMRPSYAGARFDVLSLPLIELSEGALRVTRARLLRSEEVLVAGQTSRTRIAREVSMSGSLPWTWQKPWIPPDGPVSYQAELAGIDLGFFPPIFDEIARSQASGPRSARPTLWSQLQARGNVKAQLNVTGTWSAPAVNGRLEIADGYLRAPGWQRAIDGTQVAIALERTGGHNRATVERAQAQWGSVRLALQNGSAVIDNFGADTLADNEFHGELVLSNDQLTDVYGLSVGSIAGSVGFNTRPRQPGETGPRVHDLVFHDLTTQMGGGQMKLTGTGKLTNLLLSKLDTNEFDVSLVSDNADLRYGRQMRGKLNGSVRLHRLNNPPEGGGPEKQAHLDGTMTLTQADLALAPPKVAEAAQYLGLSNRLPAPVMNVALNVGSSVLLRGMGITVPLATGPAARITGTPQLPRIAGSLRAPEGAIRVPTGMVQVKTASITYALAPVPKAAEQDRMPLELTGDINIQGERLITNAEVPGWGDTPLRAHIAVEGKLPSDYRVRVWSEPPLGEEQIIAMLGAEPLGGLVGQTEGGEPAVSQQALNLLAAGFRATIFEPIESELMRVLGLSEFNIRFGFDQELEFRLGKYVVKDLLASYQHHVGGTGDDRYQLSLAYRLKNRLHVAYTTNERNESRIKLTYDLMGRGSP